MARRKRLVSMRKPRMRVTSKGVKISKPSVRIGRKAGINISSKGISASVRTKAGTASTKWGCSLNPLKLFGCGTIPLMIC